METWTSCRDPKLDHDNLSTGWLLVIHPTNLVFTTTRKENGTLLKQSKQKSHFCWHCKIVEGTQAQYDRCTCLPLVQTYQISSIILGTQQMRSFDRIKPMFTPLSYNIRAMFSRQLTLHTTPNTPSPWRKHGGVSIII